MIWMTNFTVRYLEDSIVIEDQESNIRELSTFPDITDDQRFDQVINHLNKIGYDNITVEDQYDNTIEISAIPIIMKDLQPTANKYEVISYINDLGDKITAVELKGKFNGYIVSYEDIHIPPIESDDRELGFKYNVHYVPDGVGTIDEEFEMYVGDVLCDIIENGLKTDTLEYVYD
jgi:hypothetical protein